MNDILARGDEAEMKADGAFGQSLADAVVALLERTRRELREGLRTPESVRSDASDEEVA